MRNPSVPREVGSMCTRQGLHSGLTASRWIRTNLGTCVLLLALGATVVAQETVPSPPACHSNPKPSGHSLDPKRALPDLERFPKADSATKSHAKSDESTFPASLSSVPDLSRGLLDHYAEEHAPPPPGAPDQDWTHEPRDLPRYLIYAESHQKLGNFDRALVYYDAAIRCDSKNVHARFGRACILAEQDDFRAPGSSST